MSDFTIENHGSIVLLQANTPDAEAWVEEHLPEERQTFGVNRTVIEPRYVGDILVGIEADGLTVSQ